VKEQQPCNADFLRKSVWVDWLRPLKDGHSLSEIFVEIAGPRFERHEEGDGLGMARGRPKRASPR